MAKTRTYKELEVLPIPASIPDLGIEAGVTAVIDSVYDDGRMLLVEISGPEAPTDALIDIEVSPDGALSVVGYSTIGS